MSTGQSTEATIPLPPGRTECCFSTCMRDEDEPITMFRCSTCKNQFYCSADCQQKDWKSHKYNCSPLHGPSAGMPRGKDFDDELLKMVKILIVWGEAALTPFVPKGRQVIASLPQAQALRDLEQSQRLPQYTREIPGSAKFPFRRPLVLIVRIFLIDLLKRLSPENKKRLEDCLTNRINLGSDMPQTTLYGPKFTARPADLSPGEYAQFPSAAMPIIFGFDTGTRNFSISKEFQTTWFSIDFAIRLLWDALKT